MGTEDIVNVPLFTEANLVNILLVLLGYLSHILKKASIEKIGIIEYFTVHRARTYASIGGTIIATISLYAARPDATPMEFFAIGFMCDSIANRTPTREEIAELRQRKEGEA